MLKILRLHEINNYPVGSQRWKTSIRKFAAISLTDEEETSLKSDGYITKQLIVGPCSDGKKYQCNFKLLIVGSPDDEDFTYEAIW